MRRYVIKRLGLAVLTLASMIQGAGEVCY